MWVGSGSVGRGSEIKRRLVVVVGVGVGVVVLVVVVVVRVGGSCGAMAF